jgi:hypothetical protein
MRPGRLDLPATALLAFSDQPLSYPSHHEIGQLRQIWNGSTLMTAFGSWVAMAFLNAADGSIATTCGSARFGCVRPAADGGGVAAVDDL